MAQTDSLGHATTGTRSAWGRLMEVVDAKDGQTRYEYDAFGALLRVRDAQNNMVAALGYNLRGMKIAVDRHGQGAWTWTRNALGETTALRDAKGQVIRFEYDALGRITKRIAPDGTSSWTWGTTAAKHDIGRLASLPGPGIPKTSPTTESAVQRATRSSPMRATDSTLPTTRRDCSTRSTFPAAGAGSPFRIRHDYDAGRMSRITNAGASGEPYWTLNAQDAAGNALDESLGSMVRVVSGFTPVGGELEYRQTGIGGGTAIQNLIYEWDANGNLKSDRT